MVLQQELQWQQESILPSINYPIDHKVAMTGEISIHGNVKPIGGVYPKIKAAKKAGAKRVIIPKENMQSILNEIEGIEIIPVTPFE